MYYKFRRDQHNPLYETLGSIQYPMVIYEDHVVYLFFSTHMFISPMNEKPISRKYVEMTWTKDLKHFAPPDIILRTSGGDWDSERIEGHCILDDGTKYRMAYCGFDGKQWCVGIASTQTLASWEKYRKNPIIVNAFDPVYTYWQGRYWLYYAKYEGKAEIYCSSSKDGLTDWTHYSKPIINRGFAGWVTPTAIIPTDDLLFLLCHVGFGPLRLICVAYSYDGLIFNTVSPNILITPSAGGWDEGRILHAHACNIKGEWNVFYAALDNEGKGRIGRGIFEYSME